MTLAVLIRAHKFSAQEALLADRLETAFGARITFVADDSQKVVSTGRFPKIGIPRWRVRQMTGGRILPQWGWQFGDVFYYAAREAMPEVSHFALIESDVYLSEAAAAELAQLFNTRDEDVLAPQLGRGDAPHSFAKDLDVLGFDNLVTCFFPVTRASVSAVDNMQALRRREREHPGLRINDEALLATVAHMEGVTSGNLSALAPTLFDPAVFTPDRTQLFEHISQNHTPSTLVHPVRDATTLVARIEAMGVARNLRRRYGEALEQANPRQRRKLEQALDAADARRMAAQQT